VTHSAASNAAQPQATRLRPARAASTWLILILHRTRQPLKDFLEEKTAGRCGEGRTEH